MTPEIFCFILVKLTLLWTYSFWYWLFRPFEYCQTYRKYMCISNATAAAFLKSTDSVYHTDTLILLSIPAKPWIHCQVLREATAPRSCFSFPLYHFISLFLLSYCQDSTNHHIKYRKHQTDDRNHQALCKEETYS